MEHWLADEPVGAYIEPVAVRAKRWMRKHPSRVTAAAVLMLATVVGLTIGGLLLKRSNDLLVQKTEEADSMFHEARDAVDDYFTTVSEDVALAGEELAPLRQKLLTHALKYYQNFIRKRANDPRLQRTGRGVPSGWVSFDPPGC